MNTDRTFHISLNVSRIDATVGFYKQLFQREPVKVKPDYAKFELENPGLVISFVLSSDVNSHFGHLGFRVSSEEELNQSKRALGNHLEIALEEHNTACCYARQEKFWVNDPDGYRWEVYHFVKDEETNDERYSISPCCE